MKIFSGRINRRQYFTGFIFIIPAFFFLTILSTFIGVTLKILNILAVEEFNKSISIFSVIIFFIYTQYLGVLRFRDTGRSGLFYIFTSIIPFIHLYVIFSPGDTKENEYGPNPKDKTALEAIFKLEKKEKIVKEFAKLEKQKIKPKNYNLILYITFGILTMTLLVYYFIILPTNTKNERINCIDNANKILNSIRREREIEICVLKFK
jgi:uncharacterized membrane protein YhaH (DUF805 family)